MKKIELQVMKLRDFKGIKSLDIQMDGGNAKIFGDNAIGKTTVFDGFLWLLFDKDSNNKKDFAIKTLNGDGSERHNLEHTVEGSFLIDSVLVTLKKIYKEKWTKKRGQATPEFTGHVVDHFVDDVPMSKKEYSAKVESIVNEEVFKLLTSPTYFNEQVKWQDRRKLLLEICGDISDEDVISSNSALANLNELLSGKSLEDMKKIISSKKKHINDELEKIPVRIDEINKMTPESTVNIDVLKAEFGALENEIEQLKTQKFNVQNGDAVIEKKKQLQELEMQLTNLKRTFEADSLQEVYKLQARVQEAQGNVQIVQNDLDRINRIVQHDQSEKSNYQNKLERLENEMNELRDKWNEFNNHQFQYDDKCECPTCKQSLPAEQVQQARNEALAQFNERKSLKLNQINQDGVTLKNHGLEYNAILEKLNETIEVHENRVLVSQGQLEQKQKELDKAKHQLEKAQNSVPDVTQSEEYKSLILQKETVHDKIEKFNHNSNEVISGIEISINEMAQKKQSINSELAQFANIEANQKRITELEEQQQQLAEEYEKLEQTTFLIEEFIRTKVDMLTDRINSKFKYARFKLFDTQINGGLNEVCETLYEGVPYSSGLNNAARINVGLDIINTLSAHYGIQAPIFVDNAEAVTKFINVDTQLISLVVSEKDKQLRVELETAELKEAI